MESKELWVVTITKANLHVPDVSTFNLSADVRDWGVYASKREAADAVREGYSGCSKDLGSFLEGEGELLCIRQGNQTIEIAPVVVGDRLAGEGL